MKREAWLVVPVPRQRGCNPDPSWSDPARLEHRGGCSHGYGWDARCPHCRPHTLPR